MIENRKIKKEHFANLLVVAYSDGKLTEKELDFLAQTAVNYGLEEQEIREMLENIESLKFQIPLNNEEREKQLIDAIYLSLIDGQIAEREYQICLLLSERLGLTKKYLDKTIELIKELWKNEANKA